MKQWQVFRVYLTMKSFEFKGAEELVPNLYFLCLSILAIPMEVKKNIS